MTDEIGNEKVRALSQVVDEYLRELKSKRIRPKKVVVGLEQYREIMTTAQSQVWKYGMDPYDYRYIMGIPLEYIQEPSAVHVYAEDRHRIGQTYDRSLNNTDNLPCKIFTIEDRLLERLVCWSNHLEDAQMLYELLANRPEDLTAKYDALLRPQFVL